MGFGMELISLLMLGLLILGPKRLHTIWPMWRGLRLNSRKLHGASSLSSRQNETL